ncbi:MAG: arginine repressor [Acidobacteria bacterium]|nr:arginine repressor [Acidobacteriota bacterium]
MLGKKARQAKIIELVRENAVTSQKELARCLKMRGFHATQSTLSRDIREIGLVKARGSYQLSPQSAVVPEDRLLRRTFRDLLVRVAGSGNIVMVKTPPGNGHSLGVVLDAAQWPEILGTVAGDDTVFILLKSARLGARVIRRIEEYLA